MAGPPVDALGAALLTSRLHPLRRWAALDDVARVALYTRQSLYGALWVVAVAVLVSAAAQVGGAGRAAGVVAGGLAVCGASQLALRAGMRDLPAVPPPTWRDSGPLLALTLAYVPVALLVWDEQARGAALLVSAVAVALPLSLQPDRRVHLVLIAGVAAVFGVAADTSATVVAGVFVSLVVVGTVRASLWLFRIVSELDDARRAQTRLAVVEERLRFSRDVHDVLGRRLSTIAVQAELAATLAERGEERAAAQMLEVRGVAHEALREARALARGYRRTDFAHELEGARSLLRSAGMQVRVAVDDLPRAWHEAAGWVVREAVTNVLRHSRATRVEVDWADGCLRVVNDGARADADGDGSGLRGLRERLDPLGASLQARLDGVDRWVLEAGMPGSGPLSAKDASR